MEPGAQTCTSELLLCCCAWKDTKKKKKQEEAKTNPGSDEKPTQLAWEFKGGFQGTKVDRREEKKTRRSYTVKDVSVWWHDFMTHLKQQKK